MLLSMKSSRRKQSKPIRVSCIEGGDPATATTGLVPPTEELQPQVTEEDSTSSRDGEEPMEALPAEQDPPPVITSPSPSRDVPIKKTTVDFPTEYHRLGNQLQKASTESFLSNGHEITAEEPVSQLDSTSDPEDLRTEFPTAYHRLGNELQKDLPYLANGHSISGLDTSKDADAEKKDTSTQDSDSKDSNGEVSFKSDGTRIFHPDAYCELCDREFCNKYFLKTHKANKHGIYDNAPSPFSMSNFPSFVPSQEPLCLPQTIQPMKAELALVPASSMSTGPEPMNLNFTPIKTELTTPQQLQLKPLTEKKIQSEAPAVNPDMEDYCEICQKHFCNKYYLKKHKQDVHGITPDTSNSRRRPQLDTLPSSSTVTSAPLILPQNISSMANVMVLNPFAPPVIIHAQPFMAQHHIAPVPQPVSVAPVISQALPHPDQTPSISIASIASPLPNDALRGMGVLGAEVYCELCRKEFCNKYFLKIHMANKHGIFTDDLTRGMLSPAMFPMSSTPEDFANLTKLNEIMKAVEMERAGSGHSKQSASNETNTNVTYCNICNMEFSSKYSYKIHKMNAHGILNDNAGSPEMGEILRPDITIKTEPQEAELSRPPSQQSLSDRLSNQESGVSSMFGSMIAAKLADRVQCEICNKELCNKYFLKAHKLKLHGIDMSPFEKESKQDITPKLDSRLREDRGAKVIRDLVKEIEAQGAANKLAERPPERELVKLGIDPEAYCEICKKEFCSKYFLRTHKLKLHGIRTPKFERTPGPLISRSPRTPTLLSDLRVPLAIAPAPMANTPTKSLDALTASMTRVTSSEALVAAAMSAATAASIAANTMSIATATSNSSPISLAEMSESFEKHTWRWKEPVNSSRVACEICNKELCNKYFLRTHKLNKHGISLEEQAKTSPFTSDSDTASSTSSTCDQTKVSKDEKRSHTIQKLSESLKLKQEDEQAIMSKLYDQKTEICNLCDKRFKSMHRLQLHLLRDHSLLSPSKSHVPPAGKRSLDWLNSQKSTCHICSAEFSDLLTLQLHLIQEHNAQVSLKPEPPMNSSIQRMNHSSRVTMAMKTKYSRGTKPKVYSCLHCDYKTRWLSNIYSHEERKHKIRKASGGQANYPCTICLKTFLYEHSYLRHLRDHHQQTDIQIKPLTVQSGPTAMSKLEGFRCRKCGNRFSSRFHCLKHVREVHIRSAKAELETVKKFSPTVKKYSCKKCSFTSRIPDNLRRHKASKHKRPKHPSLRNGASSNTDALATESSVVREAISGNAVLSVALPDTAELREGSITQSFKLQDSRSDSNFVPSVIRMAVRSRVSSPVTVMFTLTPTEV